MEDVKHAYEILGVTPTMSLEEIENVYECLVDDFLNASSRIMILRRMKGYCNGRRHLNVLWKVVLILQLVL